MSLIITDGFGVCDPDLYESPDRVMIRGGFLPMRFLPFGASSTTMRFEFPAGWTATDVSSVGLAIQDRSATVLRASEDIDLYTATTLNADVARFMSSIVLDSGADDLAIGDSILIRGVTGDEIHRVKGYNSATQTVEIESILDNPHEAGDAVIGLFGNDVIDVSDTDVFPAGQAMVLKWIPAGSGDAPVTETAQITVTKLDVAALGKRFGRIYPRAYEAFRTPVDRMADMIEEAEVQLRVELMSRNLDLQRLVNQDMAAPAIMAKMAYLWCLNGDVDKEDERKVIGNEYDRQFVLLTSLPLWTDTDQNLTEDEAEITDHDPIFGKGWW